MNKINKFLISLSVIFLFAVTNVAAQQITKFGVVDTSKVYSNYYRDSSAVRNYEKKKADYQEEITKLTQELKDLQQKQFEYKNTGNDTQAVKVEAEITKKKDYIIEYTNAKNVELDSMLRALESSDDFYKKLYNALGQIAESGGYSMILSLQESAGILWYSNSVDITDQVIAKLGY